MSPARTRFRSGAAAAGAAQLLGAVGAALVVPVFLAAWGAARYGEWVTLGAAAGWVTLADLGVSNHVLNQLNAAHARGDRDGFERTLAAAAGFALAAAGLALVLLLVAAGCLPLGAWLGLEPTPRDPAAVVVVLLGLQVAASIPRALLVGLYRALGEYPRGAWLANAERALHLGVTAGTLLAGGGLVAVALAQLAPLAAAALFARADVRRRHPWVRLRLRRFNVRAARALIGPGLGFLLVQAGLVAVLQGSTLVIGAGLGAAAVAVFAAQRTLANLVRQSTGSLCNALWPELTTWAARGEGESLRAVHRLAVKGCWTLALCAGLFLALAGTDVVRVWTGGRLVPDRPLFLALVAQLVLHVPWRTSSYVLLATSRCGELALRQLLAAIAGLAAGGLLLPIAGAAGLVVALATAELALCGLGVPRRVCREIGEDWPPFRAEVLLRGLLATAVTGGIAAFALEPALAPMTAASRLGAAALAAVLLPPAWVWVAWLSAGERERVLAALLPRRAAPAGGGLR